MAELAQSAARQPETQKAATTPNPVGTELDKDISTAAAAITAARLDPSKPLFSLNSSNPTYGSGSIQEKAIACVIQTALNESLAKLGDSTRIDVDGDIRRGGATEKALSRFYDLENKGRSDETFFGSPEAGGGFDFGAKTIAALSKHSETLQREEFSLSNSVTAESLKKLAPILDDSTVLKGIGSKGECVEEIHRLAKLALGADAENYKYLAGNSVTRDTLNALSKIIGTEVRDIGRNTVSSLLKKASGTGD